MSHFQIDVDAGKTVRLPTTGKYCDRDILVSAKGGANPFEYVKGLNNLYQNLTLPDGYEVTLDLPVIEQLQGTFRNAKGFAKVKLTCNEGQLVDMWNCFSYCSATVVDLTGFYGKIKSRLIGIRNNEQIETER